MDPCTDSHHLPQRTLQSKKYSQHKTLVTDILPSAVVDAVENVTKPLRPLTAYHIYFQIEREFIIQTNTSPGNISIDPNKSFLRDVPRRYRSIRLLSDWYAGPGKRQKRKHRKSHGMIGFLELSRVISKRWATLETTDPETKRYVTRIAKRELEEYKLEMKHYKELTSADAAAAAVKTQPSQADWARTTTVSPVASPRPDDYVCDDIDDGIDYSICTVSSNGHYFPSPCLIDPVTFIDPDELSICDPLFELEDGQISLTKYPFSNSLGCMRCVSPVLSSSSSDLDFLNVGGGFLL